MSGEKFFSIFLLQKSTFLKLAEQKIFGSTIHETIRRIIQDWIGTNDPRLKEWGIDRKQIELIDKKR